jgi:hypothetical protein
MATASDAIEAVAAIGRSTFAGGVEWNQQHAFGDGGARPRQSVDGMRRQG